MDPWDFSQFMPGAGMPEMPQMAPPDPVQGIGQTLAQQGIRLGQFLQNPSVAGPALAPAGSSIQDPWNPQAPASSGMDASAAGAPTDKQGDLAMRLKAGLQGVQGMAPPKPQTVHTPAAPRPSTQIQGGQLMALLQALGAGGGAEGRRALPMPSTLGQSLAGR